MHASRSAASITCRVPRLWTSSRFASRLSLARCLRSYRLRRCQPTATFPLAWWGGRWFKSALSDASYGYNRSSQSEIRILVYRFMVNQFMNRTQPTSLIVRVSGLTLVARSLDHRHEHFCCLNIGDHENKIFPSSSISNMCAHSARFRTPTTPLSAVPQGMNAALAYQWCHSVGEEALVARTTAGRTTHWL